MQIRRSDFTSPEHLGSRRLPPRANFYHFPDAESAKKIFKEFSPFTMDLDGTWQFRYTTSPETLSFDAPESEWCDVKVPDCWTMRGFARPQYTNVVMPFRELPPEVPAVNPTGVYQRTFELPASWAERRSGR